jgi:hypothetical protein
MASAPPDEVDVGVAPGPTPQEHMRAAIVGACAGLLIFFMHVCPGACPGNTTAEAMRHAFVAPWKRETAFPLWLIPPYVFGNPYLVVPLSVFVSIGVNDALVRANVPEARWIVLGSVLVFFLLWALLRILMNMRKRPRISSKKSHMNVRRDLATNRIDAKTTLQEYIWSLYDDTENASIVDKRSMQVSLRNMEIKEGTPFLDGLLDDELFFRTFVAEFKRDVNRRVFIINFEKHDRTTPEEEAILKIARVLYKIVSGQSPSPKLSTDDILMGKGLPGAQMAEMRLLMLLNYQWLSGILNSILMNKIEQFYGPDPEDEELSLTVATGAGIGEYSFILNDEIGNLSKVRNIVLSQVVYRQPTNGKLKPIETVAMKVSWAPGMGMNVVIRATRCSNDNTETFSTKVRTCHDDLLRRELFFKELVDKKLPLPEP